MKKLIVLSVMLSMVGCAMAAPVYNGNDSDMKALLLMQGLITPGQHERLKEDVKKPDNALASVKTNGGNCQNTSKQ